MYFGKNIGFDWSTYLAALKRLDICLFCAGGKRVVCD